MSKWSILVVEDEPDAREVMAEVLGQHEIATDVVGSAEEALSLLAERQYTAAVIDLALPGMDGLALIRKMRSNPQTADLPCVAVTAYHSSLVKKQALDAGCNAYMSKPVDNGYLLRELERVISG